MKSNFLAILHSVFSLRTLIPAIVGLICPTVQAQTSYNAASDFALTQGGTNGTWFYGKTASDTDNTFIQYTLNDSTPSPCAEGTYQRWFDNAPEDPYPQIARNNTAVSCLEIPPGALFLHPGPAGQRSVLRWIAPTAGTFQVTGVAGRQGTGTTTDIRILKNATGTPLLSGNIDATSEQPFNFTVTVAAGDSLDFSLGWGDGTYQNDGSILAVDIGPPVVACQPPPANQRVWLPGENSTVDVQSGDTRGTLAGDATYSPGRVGRAFKFDGMGDFVAIPDNAAQRAPVDAITLEGWFKFQNTDGVPTLIGKPLRDTWMNSYHFYLYGRQLVAYVSDGSQYTQVLSTYTPPLNTWTHLAFTFSRSGGVSTLKLYANGIDVTYAVEGTPDIPIAYDADPYPLLIGADYEYNVQNYFLNGEADEPSVYSRALTQAEIQAIVRQGSFGKCLPSTLPAQPAPAMPPANQVAWFTGDGEGNSLVGSLVGTLENGASYGVGKVGQAFKFDGSDDKVVVGNNPALNITGNQLTIEAWIQLDSDAEGGHQIVGMASSAEQPAGRKFGFGIRGDRSVGFELHTTNDYADYQTSPGVIQNGVPTHVAAVYNGSQMIIYVNGVESSTLAMTGNIVTSSGDFVIGQFPEGGYSPFKGLIDEVGIYNRALSPAELGGIYNAGLAGKLKSKSTLAGSNLITKLSDVTINYAGVSNAGTTSSSGIDLGLLPPLPSNVTFTGLAYNISADAAYQNGNHNDLISSFNVPALPTADFNLLRVLHLENGKWVNRTRRTSVAPSLSSNNLKSLSPFVIVEAEAAFAGLEDQYTPEDTPKSFNFTVTDPGTITSITATSSDATIVPNAPANLTVTGSGSTRTVNVTPAADQIGETEITVTIARGSSVLSDTITLVVTEVNDPPIPVADLLSPVAEDSAQRTIPIATLLANDLPGPANEAGQNLILTVVSNPVGGSVGISGANVLFTPAANFNGTASFSYRVQDNGTTNFAPDPRISNAGSVSFTITEVNDAPTATGDTLSAVLEDSTTRSIPFASLTGNDSAGPANEGSQTLVVATVSNPIGGTVSISGTNVLFAPALNFNGTALFSYTVQDNGTTNGGSDFLTSAPATVTFTVTAVNDRPSFTIGADQVKPWNAGSQSVANWATAISSGPSNESGQILQFAITGNTNPGLFSVAPSVSASGALTYTPASGVSGTATVSLVLSDDGGTANGGQDTSVTQTFTVTIQDEYTSWRQQYFTLGELGNAAISGPLADPDFDGSCNLLEYAVGSHPRTANGSSATAGIVESGGQEYLAISYTQPVPPRSLINVTVTRATTLAPANWAGGQVVVHSVVPGPGALETVTVRSLLPVTATPAAFLRMEVTPP